MNYDEWLKSVPVEITGDSLWKVEVLSAGAVRCGLGLA